MNSIRKGLMAAVLVVSSAAIQAQTVSCATGDAACYQRQYEHACAERNVSTAESCEAWIRQTDGRDRVAQLMQGHGWMAIANHLDASPALKQQSREKGVAIFRQLAAADRSDAEALLALSTVTEDATERLQLLRQVVRLKPGGAIAVESLARELEKLGGREHLLEAAEAVERASSAQTGTPRMRLAERAIALFEAAGAPDRARELRQRFRQNVGADSRAGERIQSTSPRGQSASESLHALCEPVTVRVSGAADCLNSLERVVASLRGPEKPADAQPAADNVASVTLELAQEAELALYEADVNWRTRFGGWTEALISTGLGSAEVHSTNAALQLDKARKAEALERAVRLQPDHAGLALSLGLQYLLQQRWDDALATFHNARNLPAAATMSSAQLRIMDEYIRQAEKGRQNEARRESATDPR